jgi:hypothetical protein
LEIDRDEWGYLWSKKELESKHLWWWVEVRYIYIWTLWSSSSIGDFRGLVICGRSNKERDFLVLGRFRVSFGSWSSEDESSYGVLGHRMWFKRKEQKEITVEGLVERRVHWDDGDGGGGHWEDAAMFSIWLSAQAFWHCHLFSSREAGCVMVLSLCLALCIPLSVSSVAVYT